MSLAVFRHRLCIYRGNLPCGVDSGDLYRVGIDEPVLISIRLDPSCGKGS